MSSAAGLRHPKCRNEYLLTNLQRGSRRFVSLTIIYTQCTLKRTETRVDSPGPPLTVAMHHDLAIINHTP